jgi:hypothetical protein
LKHGEAKDVVWETQEYVVGSHIHDEMQRIVSNQELERTCARDVFVLHNKVAGVEQLNDSLPGIGFSSENGGDDVHLTRTSPVEQARTICTEDRIPIGVFSIVRYVVRDELDIIGPSQIPAQLTQATERLPSRFGSAETRPWIDEL